MKNVVMLLPLDPMLPKETSVRHQLLYCISRPTKGKGYKGVWMRIDSTLQIPPTDLNDLVIVGHCGEEGQAHEHVWSESLFLLGLDLLNHMHPSFLSQKVRVSRRR